MAADLNKLVSHPDKENIIQRLISGDSPKTVSTYLKEKYSNADDSHLRLPSTVMQDFLDTYANHHGYIQKVIKNECDSKLEKEIAKSLLNNKTFKERIHEEASKTLDLNDKIRGIITILEARAEQLFDHIQSNPESTKADYIFTKYMELFMLALEKADKIINKAPDVRIEHTYTVQMVEQQSAAFQEAIRRVLERMSPEFTYTFMDLLQQEMQKLNPKDFMDNAIPASFEKEEAIVTKALQKAKDLDEKFDEEK